MLSEGASQGEEALFEGSKARQGEGDVEGGGGTYPFGPGLVGCGEGVEGRLGGVGMETVPMVEKRRTIFSLWSDE